MQLLNIFLTNRFIFCHSSDFSLQNSYQEIPDSPQNIETFLTHFATFLDSLSPPKNATVNLVLEQSFLSFHYVTFPLVNRGKIRKILEFELEETLLSGVENSRYDYYHRPDRERSITEVGVYSIDKTLLNALIQACKSRNLEVRWVLSLNNLIDIKFRDEATPDNLIYISIHETMARIMVYKKGFLTGSSVVYTEENASISDDSIFQSLIGSVNQKINAILLHENNIQEIVLNESAQGCLKTNDSLELEITRAFQGEESPPNHLTDLTTPSILNQSARINLLKTNLLLMKELKNHQKTLVISFGVLIACLSLFIGSVIYQGVRSGGRYDELTQSLERAIDTYLPKGTSKTNSVYILRERVSELIRQKEATEKYAVRAYQISKLLTSLSLIKKKASSLHLDRLSNSGQAIKIQGTVRDETDFELLKEQLGDLFPKTTHSLNYSQKNLGNESIQFSITIRVIKSRR